MAYSFWLDGKSKWEAVAPAVTGCYPVLDAVLLPQPRSSALPERNLQVQI